MFSCAGEHIYIYIAILNIHVDSMVKQPAEVLFFWGVRIVVPIVINIICGKYITYTNTNRQIYIWYIYIYIYIQETCSSGHMMPTAGQELVTANVLELAKNKVSSNVVERCFEATTVGPDSTKLVPLGQGILRILPGRITQTSGILQDGLKCFKNHMREEHIWIELTRNERTALMAAVLGSSGDTRAPFAQLMTDKCLGGCSFLSASNKSSGGPACFKSCW